LLVAQLIARNLPFSSNKNETLCQEIRNPLERRFLVGTEPSAGVPSAFARALHDLSAFPTSKASNPIPAPIAARNGTNTAANNVQAVERTNL
jgi:hypothetical protein